MAIGYWRGHNVHLLSEGDETSKSWTGVGSSHTPPFEFPGCQLSMLQNEHSGHTGAHMFTAASPPPPPQCLVLCWVLKFQSKIYGAHEWGQQEQPSHFMDSVHYYHDTSAKALPGDGGDLGPGTEEPLMFKAEEQVA